MGMLTQMGENLTMENLFSDIGLKEDWLIAIGILAIHIALAGLIRLFWRMTLLPIFHRYRPGLGEAILPPIRTIVVWTIILKGVDSAYRALEFAQTNEQLTNVFSRGIGVVWSVIFLIQAMKLSSAFFTWQLKRRVEQGESLSDVGFRTTILRKIVGFLIIAFSVLSILKSADVDISPLLAGGAIGGIVIGLALQDTLSNLFAGFYLAIDRPVRVGDFVRLESGDEGFVEEIGWRNTRVKLWSNNLVVLPNTKMSQSAIINYYLPQQESSVYVYCSVAYGSDLQKAEEIAHEVAVETQNRVTGCQTDWDPLIRWLKFGDSGIEFQAILRVHEFPTSYVLKSEYIKALHARYTAEGIEIPYPIRELRFGTKMKDYIEHTLDTTLTRHAKQQQADR